ncbi:protein odr-4 homolog [Drosophila sulfurigaster albostrigata]|uniref:protein odr-4 homolog n=1 Tax=Drosophila sulfurigaster albostrigata TaxID=89887 RepID=UPI002D21B7AA|nr:protein odr-4 homolog [Drosophila sulfurigaster albostrigata]
MRTVLLSKADEVYLEKCAQEHSFSYGIIVGHQADLTKSIVVHLARNNEEDADLEDLNDVNFTIRDVNSQALASQWLSASKMCPGSFDVIGIFISSTLSEVADENSEEFKNAKKLFSDVYDLLLQSNSSFGVYTTDMAQTEYVFLAYSLADKRLLCKNFTYGNGGTFTKMDHRFVEKPFEWIPLECNYDLDDVIPIIDPARRINIEEQFQNIILTIRKYLIASEVFLQNEIVEDTIDLQTYIKKKKQSDDKLKTSSSTNSTASGSSTATGPASGLHLLSSDDGSNGNGNVIRASIVMPVKCQLNSPANIKISEFNGTLRMSGMIFSRIYCNSRNTIADVKRFVRDDVLRSLITRIQVYCDGLTDPHVSNEAVYISEPPRRVFFSIPADGASPSTSTIQFSEYLFRGEAPTVAVSQAKQVLDVEIDPEAIVLDAEGLPDSNFTARFQETDNVDDNRTMSSSMPKRELSRSLYMVGIAVALLVLLASVALHYVMA